MMFLLVNGGGRDTKKLMCVMILVIASFGVASTEMQQEG